MIIYVPPRTHSPNWAKVRIDVLVERITRMLRLGLDLASWSFGPAVAAWYAGYHSVSNFCANPWS